MDSEYKKWLSQFRKGYIELCTLLTLKQKGALNGTALLRFFEEMDLFVNEGTLYPLLNRMELNGWLKSSWKVPKTSGHPKREYVISKKGEEILPLLINSYDLHHKSIENIKKDK